MTIRIITTYTPVVEYDLGHFSIDLSRKSAVLIRQSMKNASKDHYESRLLQENLIPIAIKVRGDEDDRNILVFDEGAGISGMKGYDQREKLSALYLAIANDIVGSLFLTLPDRLFRDKLPSYEIAERTGYPPSTIQRYMKDWKARQAEATHEASEVAM